MWWRSKPAQKTAHEPAPTALLAPLIAHAALIRFIIIINIFTTTYKTNDKYYMYIENKHIIMYIEKKVELPVLPQTMRAYIRRFVYHMSAMWDFG